MNNLGEKLKKRREALGLNLQKVAKISRLRQAYLERLEKGEYEKLPADIYTRNFLKTYSKIIGLNENEIIKEYEKERGLIDEKPKSQKQKKLSISGLLSRLLLSRFRYPFGINYNFILTPRFLSWLFFIFIFLLSLFYIIWQLDFFISPPKINLIYPEEDLVVYQNLIEINGNVSQESKLTINGQAINIDKDGNFREAISLQSGINTITIEATNKIGKKNSIIRQIVKKE